MSGGMVKQTIQIYARVKPLGRRQQAGIYSVGEDEKSASNLEILVPRDLAEGFVNNKRESYRFNITIAHREHYWEGSDAGVTGTGLWRFSKSSLLISDPHNTVLISENF
nr:kinesin-like protein KIF6 isoform X1 [Pelodiscus sinensis]|eukprot:XP_025040977.1 kinesin-like protein KIF6 isoform X1 [Pelodiscus sinensis]